MSRFLLYVDKGKEADSNVSLESVQSILHVSTPSEVSIQTFSHHGIQVAYSGKVSIHLDESRGLLAILSGYFRRPGLSATYSHEAKDLLPLFDGINDPLKEDFEGCFSLVVCDLKSTDIRLMTDRFGTRPLYFCSGEQNSAVSSDIFLLVPFIDTLSIVSAALSDSFWLGFCRAPETLFLGIAKVPDNSVVNIGKANVTQTYIKRPPLVIEPDETLDLEKVVGRIEKTLEDEFASLSGIVNRVAVLLSGGVDSSILAAYAVKYFDECVAFTCEIEGFQNPELERAKYVADKLGLQHHIVKLSLDEIDGIFSEVVSILEGPSRHINNIVVRRLFREIKGFDAIIGGDGADALFGTRTNRTIVNIEKKIKLMSRLPAPLKAVVSGIFKGLKLKKGQHLEKMLTNDLESLLCELFTINYGEQETVNAGKLGVSRFLNIPFGTYKSSSTVGKSIEANFSLFLRGMLERNTRLSDDSGIPVYYPFLSEGMFRISRQLSYRCRFDESGNAKPALREICRRRIDNTVIEWPKIGFETPEKAWLSNQLKHHLDRALSDNGGISKVLGLNLDPHDIAITDASNRIIWWLITLDASLLEADAKCRNWQEKRFLKAVPAANAREQLIE